MNIQSEMDKAFDNYLSISVLLQADLDSILRIDDDSAAAKRNLLRVLTSLIEGYCHCFREICLVCLKSEDIIEFSKKEEKVLIYPDSFSLPDRVKHTIKASYKALKITPVPIFGCQNWKNASNALIKRHQITHPKSSNDLALSKTEWECYHSGITWLTGELFRYIGDINSKYGQSTAKSK